MQLDLTEFDDRREASDAAAAIAATCLIDDIARLGRATLMVSGGSTPTQMFAVLATLALGWDKVTVGLVDERWVPGDDAHSNERLVRANLLQGRAAAATFVPMKTAHATVRAALKDRDAAYAPLCRELSFLLLGMGEDGHTASWFPGLDNLREVVSVAHPGAVEAVEARGALVPQRMTLTGSAIVQTRRAVLLVFGEDKRRVVLSSGDADPVDCPVRFAMDSLGDRLSVYWAP